MKTYSYRKLSILPVLAVFLALPVVVDAYCGGGDSFFWPSPCNAIYQKPREQLVVYAFGPSSPPRYQEVKNYYPSAYNSMASIAPGYYQPSFPYGYGYQQPYVQPFQSYQPYFGAPFMGYEYAGYGYGATYGASYGSYGGYGPMQTNDYDALGNPLCQWGGFPTASPCSFDPHQPVYDVYTGTYY